MRQRLDVFGCVGRGCRWGIQTLAIWLTEGGNIMRLCLTEECRVQSLRKCVKAEEGRAAGYETGWERDGFSLGLRKRWLLCPTQEEQPKLPQRFLRTNPTPPGGSGGYCSDDTVLSQLQYYFATCPISHPPCPCSHPEKGLWQCSHVMGRQPEKPFNPGPSSPGKIGHYFCSSKMPCSLQGGKALAGDRKSGNDCTSLGFQVPLVGDRRLLLSQMQFKGSIAPESCSPRTGSVGVEWGPETLTLSCFPRRGKTLWEASGRELQSIHWSNWPWE